MQESVLDVIVCPWCKGKLSVVEPSVRLRVSLSRTQPRVEPVLTGHRQTSRPKEIKEGVLKCQRCSTIFPIKNYIPRFVTENNYASSFGMQWNIHARTQIDKFNGTTISKDRFFNETNWPVEEIKKEKILEVGCGAGRFTQVVLDTGATCFAIDYTNAVDACWANNGPAERLHLFQADIYQLPFRQNFFDKIYCLGVLQHTPDVRRAFLSMLPFLKTGGEIVVDIYASPMAYLHPRHLLRPITTRMRKEHLYRIITRLVPYLLPISILIRKIPVIGILLARLVPIANYQGVLPLPDKALPEWAVLDTFDWLATRYEQPQTLGNLKQWFTEAKLSNLHFKRIRAIYIGKGTKS